MSITGIVRSPAEFTGDRPLADRAETTGFELGVSQRLLGAIAIAAVTGVLRA